MSQDSSLLKDMTGRMVPAPSIRFGAATFTPLFSDASPTSASSPLHSVPARMWPKPSGAAALRGVGVAAAVGSVNGLSPGSHRTAADRLRNRKLSASRAGESDAVALARMERTKKEYEQIQGRLHDIEEGCPPALRADAPPQLQQQEVTRAEALRLHLAQMLNKAELESAAVAGTLQALHDELMTRDGSIKLQVSAADRQGGSDLVDLDMTSDQIRARATEQAEARAKLASGAADILAVARRLRDSMAGMASELGRAQQEALLAADEVEV